MIELAVENNTNCAQLQCWVGLPVYVHVSIFFSTRKSKGMSRLGPMLYSLKHMKRYANIWYIKCQWCLKLNTFIVYFTNSIAYVKAYHSW